MSVRHMGMAEWQRECAATLKAAPEGEDSAVTLQGLMGPSPGGAAAVLGITRQRVHQLILVGQLDAVYVWDDHKSRRGGARPAMVMLSEVSMERWRKSKPGEQALLPLVKPRRRVRA